MDTLIDSSGQPRFGVFDTTPARINWRDFDYRTVLGARQSGFKRWLRFKQFDYFGIVADDLIAGCALANLRVAGAGFVYAFQPSTGRMQSHSLRTPLARGMHLTNAPMAGESVMEARKFSLRQIYSGTARQLLVEAPGLRIDATFDESTALCDPMSICTRTARNGWVYARKIAGTPVRGTVACEFGNFDLTASKAHAHHDYSAGYMRRDTCWNWACLSGADSSGRRIGLNVSCGVNETSFSENCAWVDGVRYPLAGCSFEFSRDKLDAPWHVRSADGALNLAFQPLGRHTERLNVPVLRRWIASDFRQDFGRFTGTMTLPGIDAVQLDGQLGFCEDQFARW